MKYRATYQYLKFIHDYLVTSVTTSQIRVAENRVFGKNLNWNFNFQIITIF